jgi:hypothetical protein
MQHELRNRAPRDQKAELRRQLADFMAENPDLLITHTPGSPYEVAVTGDDGQPELIQEYDLAVFLDRVKAAVRGGS